MLRKLRGKSGFTLIELMIAAMILSITGLVLYYMFIQGQVLSMEQEHKLFVFQLAKKRLAIYQHASQARILDPGTITGTEDVELPVNENNRAGDDEAPLTVNYIVEVDEASTHDYVTVQVRYTWVELSGRTYEITLKDAYPYD